MSTKPSNSKRQKRIAGILVNGTLLLIVVLWTIPPLGVLVSSFRSRFDIQTSGWWAIFPHQEWVKVSEMDIPEGVDPNGTMEILGVTGTFDEFRNGVTTPNGQRVTWLGNKRLGRIEVQEQRWTTRTDFTLDNSLSRRRSFPSSSPPSLLMASPGCVSRDAACSLCWS